MGVTIRVDLDRAAIRRLTSSPDGMVGREVRRVTEKVADRARAGAPVDTGELKGSISTAYRQMPGRIEGHAYSTVEHSLYVQRGTGIYGPTGQPIRPRRSPFLVFPSRTGGGLVFAREVRGQRAQPFMLEALRSASPWPVIAL